MSGETTTAVPSARRITVAGAEHEIPKVLSFDMDEAQVLYDYSNLHLEDFVPDETGEITDERASEIAQKMRNPGFLRTLLHVAYRRSNPRMPREQIAKIVSAENFAEKYAEWVEWLLEDDEEDGEVDDPPADSAMTPTPTTPTPPSDTDFYVNDSEDSLTSSGTSDSEPTGPTEPEEILAHTGAMS